MENGKLLRWVTGLCQLVTVLAVILLVAGQARAMQPVTPPATLPATGTNQTAPPPESEPAPESTPAPQGPNSGVTPPAPQSPDSAGTAPGFFEKRRLKKEVTERYNALAAKIEWMTDEQRAALDEIAAALGR